MRGNFMNKSKKCFFFLSTLFSASLIFALAFGFNINKRAEAVNADGGLEIVSVDGTPVMAEPTEETLTQGHFPVGWVGKPYTATVEATGGTGDYTWSVVIGSLPKGLTLNASTGVLSGTPTETVTGDIYVRVTDSLEVMDTAALSLIVAEDDWIPTITTKSLSNGVVGIHYFEELNADFAFNDFDIDWTLESGTLPTGLSLGKSGRWDGTLSGTPTETGTFNFTLRAENMLGYDTREYTIEIENRLTITFPDEIYYLGDNVQLTASNGNENVEWGISNSITSASTAISQDGLLKIGLDETAPYVTVFAASKTNKYNNNQETVYFTHAVPHPITIIDGVALNHVNEPTTRAAYDESVSIVAVEKDGMQFREWTVEDGSVAVTIDEPTYSSTWFDMPDGAVIIKANYDKIIDTVYASFDIPVNGNHIDKTLQTGVGYTAHFVNVYALSEASALDLDKYVYVADEFYSYYIEFEPAPGYVFENLDEMNVTINGQVMDFNKDYAYSQGWLIQYTAVSEETSYFSVDVTDGVPSLTFAKEGDTVTVVANEPETGYVFNKWVSKDVTFANEKNAQTTFVMPNKAVSVTATYKEVGQYTVSFDANGGTGTISSQNVNEGSEFTLPECTFVAPTNQVFKCWSVNNEEKAVGDKIVINADVVVKAIWKGIPQTISFNANGGTGTMANVTVDKGSQYTLPECGFNAPEGKEFQCWKVGDDSYNPGDKIVVNGDISVSANWQDKTTPAPTPTPEGNSGLSGGAIAGIVIGSVVVLGIGGFALVWFVLKKKTWADFVGLFKKK